MSNSFRHHLTSLPLLFGVCLTILAGCTSFSGEEPGDLAGRSASIPEKEERVTESAEETGLITDLETAEQGKPPETLIIPTENTAITSDEGGVAEMAAIAPTCPEPDLYQAGRICYIGIGGNTLVHPISMVSDGLSVWLLDGGRLMKISVENPTEPAIILQPGDLIDGAPVQEPFDLALVQDGLLVLDRVGDVYRLNFDDNVWRHDRFARPIGETSSHYYVSLASNGIDRYLLETSYRYGLRYLPNQAETGWSVPEDVILVDLAIGDPLPDGGSVAYLLQREIDAEQSTIIRYLNGVPDTNFAVPADIRQPREIQIGPTALYLLDRAGQRITVLNATNGTILSQTELLYPITTFSLHLDQFGSSQLTYAGRNTIYLPGQPETEIVIETTLTLPDPQPHNIAVWSGLPDFVLPILNLPVDRKELRLPGAPRHYRQGIHQGMDFYWGPGRDVLASAGGTVIRAMTAYQPTSTSDFIYWNSVVNELGFTPPDGLDFYRGRQVWVEHENGFISRYAHLGAIDPAIVEGGTVTQGQRIGAVGNSGSPGSLEGADVDTHLHYEIWIGDHYFGQYLRPIEVRELVETLFINR